MLSRLFNSIRGIFSGALYILNLLICSPIFYIAAPIKIVYRGAKGRQLFEKIGYNAAKFYAFLNDQIISLTCPTVWEIDDTSHLSDQQWYLLLCNHQSWIDIIILEKVFVRKIPMLKFFIKWELRWVPFVGTTCWVLNFPFMKRYSKEFLAKNPHLRGQDLETTRKSCADYQNFPTTLINFAEGTRFTPQKQAQQQSSFQYLLKPKAGGAAFTLAAMNGKLKELIDVTIIYHGNKTSAWDYLCGRIPKISIRFNVTPITDDLIGDYQNDEAFKTHFQDKLNHIWLAKDQLIAQERQHDRP